MATLNITYNGLSSDVPLESDGPLADADVRRIAAELLGLARADTFQHYVVDRFPGPRGEERIYLRPKVPFGA
ncbi:hypothetical protein [Archangium primigenium]|uniref:hypothetical protein n=1 Tax=Melittangium TaxID=44 RepID=UPI0019578F0E|nr:hypothetical protein [Archangium primigenium]MBM7118461.1 hypothetical protein [Archangium primigenium]